MTCNITENKDWGNCLVIMDDQVVMLRHYRHGIRDTVLEIPAGHIEPDDPTSTAAIQRELAEELGLRDARIHYVGKTYANPANQTNVTYSFLAVGGTLTADTDIHEEYFTVVPLSLQEFARVLKEQSETFQALHLANILLSFQYIARYDGDDAEVAALKPFVRGYFGS